MSTFLSGARLLARKCGVNEPVTVASQSGEAKRLVEDYKEAYQRIEARHRWRWLRKPFTLATVDGKDTYAYSDCIDSDTTEAISRLHEWRIQDNNDPPKIYLASAGIGGERWLIYAQWNDFKMIYKIGSQNSNTGAPAHITIDPDNNLVIGPSPNGVYTITGDYYMSSQALSVDGDIPEMPTQFHDLIAYSAAIEYGIYEEVNEVVFRRLEKRAKRMMRQLEANQLPKMTFSRPMA